MQYEIRKGASFGSAQVIGRFAHPPVPVYGDGVYWIAAVTVVAGITAYSAAPATLTTTNSYILENSVASYDENASGWTGTVSGSVTVVSGAIQTTNTGGFVAGQYEIPASHWIDIGGVLSAKISITWTSAGVPVGANVLALADYLGTADFLNAGTGSSVDVHPEIAISQDGITFGAYQRYSPGYYLGRKFKARLQLIPLVSAVYAVATGFTFTVDIRDSGVPQ